MDNNLKYIEHEIFNWTYENFKFYPFIIKRNGMVQSRAHHDALDFGSFWYRGEYNLKSQGWLALDPVLIGP